MHLTQSEIRIVQKKKKVNAGPAGVESCCLRSTLALAIETMVMEMVQSMFYWLNETMFKLCGEGRLRMYVHDLGKTSGGELSNLVSWRREWRRRELSRGADGVSGSIQREVGNKVVMFSSVMVTESTMEWECTWKKLRAMFFIILCVRSLI
jgi:hypothetical protein